MNFWRRGVHGTKGEHDEVVILGRQIIASSYPAELVAFDDVAVALRRGRPSSPRRLRVHAGARAESGGTARVLPPVLTSLTTAVAGSALDWAVGTLPESSRRRIADLLHRSPGASALTRAEETAVHDTVLAVAMVHHQLDPPAARQLAQAVLDALRLRAEGRM